MLILKRLRLYGLAALLLASAVTTRPQEPTPPPTGEEIRTQAQATAPAEEPGPHGAKKEKPKTRFKDPEDRAFDLSEYLLFHRGFLPVPFLVTEPAVGYGAGLGAVWFHKSIAEMQAESQASGTRMAPPDIAVLAGFKTDNGTWGAGAAYIGSTKGDRFRYFALVAKADMNLDFYGPRDVPHRFTIQAPMLKVDGLTRLGGSDWFAGARYIYFGATSRFDRVTPSAIAPHELESDLGKLSLLLDYDSRDNTLTPSRGTFAEIDLGWARPAFGSTRSFESHHARAYTYLPFKDRAVLGLRGDLRVTAGRVPFYAKPYLSLRGIPAMRYQGQDAALAEGELRYKLTGRWALVLFGGAGKAYGGRKSFSDAETALAGGTGFRYLLARKLGLWAGIDIARGSGTDKMAIYFQVGSAWR